MYKFRRLLTLFSTSLLILIIMSFAIGHIRGNFILDLLNHFRPYFLIVSVVILLVNFRVYKRQYTILVILLVTILNYHMIHFPSFHFTDESGTLKVLHLNLLMGNENYDAVRQLIAKEDPDIISFQECTPDWFIALAPLLAEFQTTQKIIDSPFGICVASRIPVVQSEVLYLNNQRIPLIKLELEYKGEFITLYSVHPTPPFNQGLFESRNEYFELLINEVGIDESVIIVGDLNITQWSPYYQKFRKTLNLRNSDFLFSSTWPEFFPIQIFQLDHILTSKRYRFKSSKVLNSIGSDHFPIVTDIVISDKKN